MTHRIAKIAKLSTFFSRSDIIKFRSLRRWRPGRGSGSSAASPGTSRPSASSSRRRARVPLFCGSADLPRSRGRAKPELIGLMVIEGRPGPDFYGREGSNSPGVLKSTFTFFWSNEYQAPVAASIMTGINPPKTSKTIHPAPTLLFRLTVFVWP